MPAKPAHELTVSEATPPAVSQPAPPVAPINEPTRLIELAIHQNADIDKLEKLMDLQQRYNQDQSRKAFNVALSRFQAHCPTIAKTKTGHNYKYAPLGDIISQIKAHLSQCGLSYRFEQTHDKAIQVTCIIGHIDGHSERNTMTAMPDTSGSKNAVQAIGSTSQYLMRYTLSGALGITTADEDTDGVAPQAGHTVAQLQTDNTYPADRFNKNYSGWVHSIGSGKMTPENVITKIQSSYTLSQAQLNKINAIKRK